jgi:hypothetical protein
MLDVKTEKQFVPWQYEGAVPMLFNHCDEIKRDELNSRAVQAKLSLRSWSRSWSVKKLS